MLAINILHIIYSSGITFLTVLVFCFHYCSIAEDGLLLDRPCCFKSERTCFTLFILFPALCEDQIQREVKHKEAAQYRSKMTVLFYAQDFSMLKCFSWVELAKTLHHICGFWIASFWLKGLQVSLQFLGKSDLLTAENINGLTVDTSCFCFMCHDMQVPHDLQLTALLGMPARRHCWQPCFAHSNQRFMH